MGHHYNAKVVLGTATPSLESAYNVHKGKYGIQSLKKRYGGFSFPKVQNWTFTTNKIFLDLFDHCCATCIESLEGPKPK